jgi:hypothetical protein
MISKLLIRRLGLILPALMISGVVLAQINHTIIITSPAMDKIKFGDLMKFDPKSSGGTSRVIFRATLTNSDKQNPAELAINSIKFYVDFNGTPLPLSMKNDNVVKFAPGETITLSNVNALKQDGRFNFKIDGPDPDIDLIVPILFGQGKKSEDINIGAPLPAGAYNFHLVVNDEDKVATLTLSNPSGYISIMGPGSVFLEDDPAEIYDRNPAISWSGDAPEFELRVVLVDPTVDKTIEDLKNKNPQFKEITKNKFRRYPNTDLQAGKVYAILLASRVNSMGSASAEETWATPFWFTIPEAKSASEVAGNDIINKLKAIFGDDYAAIFEQIKSGKVKGSIMIDGKSVTFQELAVILQKLQTGEANLESFDVN